MTIPKTGWRIDLDIRKDIRSGKLQTSVLLFILFSAIGLVFYGYLGSDVGGNFISFWTVLAKAAGVAFLLGYNTKPFGDFFVSQPKEVGDDQG